MARLAVVVVCSDRLDLATKPIAHQTESCAFQHVIVDGGWRTEDRQPVVDRVSMTRWFPKPDNVEHPPARVIRVDLKRKESLLELTACVFFIERTKPPRGGKAFDDALPRLTMTGEVDFEIRSDHLGVLVARSG